MKPPRACHVGQETALSLQLHEERRLSRNVQRRLTKKPLTGAYHWVPIPTKSSKRVEWTLLEFYDRGHSGSAEHRRVWPAVVRHLALKWEKSERWLQHELADSLYGLPRGRVNQMADGTYGLAHGHDVPVTNPIKIVKQAFNLKGAIVKVYLDEHERMLPGSPQAIQQALGTGDLGLNKVASIDTE